MKTLKATLLPLMIAAFTSACTLIPKPLPATQAYDLGVMPDRGNFGHLHLPQGVVLDHITAAPWLQSDSIYYRFSYVNRTQLSRYTRSRWLAPPAFLLSEQLSNVLGDRNDWQMTTRAKRIDLKLKLLRFEQIFTGPHESHALIQIQASLVQPGTGNVLTQRVFRLDHCMASPDAAGAVSALGKETNRFISALVRWLQRVDD